MNPIAVKLVALAAVVVVGGLVSLGLRVRSAWTRRQIRRLIADSREGRWVEWPADAVDPPRRFLRARRLLDPTPVRKPRGLWRQATATAAVGLFFGFLHSPLLFASPSGTTPAPTATLWFPPIPQLHVVRGFDPPGEPWLAGNRGVDLAGHPGETVHASGAGVVTFAGEVARVGVVSVTSGDLRTTYEPVSPRVHTGERVKPDDVLGRLSADGSHCPLQTCLHWGLLRRTAAGDWAYLDPLALLGMEQVRLLPLVPAPSTPAARTAAARRRL